MSSPGTLRFGQVATKPSPPPSGYDLIYVKTDDVLYIQDSAGVEVALGSASAITSIIGDGTASGPGAATLTINFVGGASAASIAAAATAISTATPNDVPNTVVERNSSGNFSAGIITASLNGNATTATTATTSISFSGNLLGDVTGTQSATTVARIQGTAVNPTAPTDAQFLVYQTGIVSYRAVSLNGDIRMTDTGTVSLIATTNSTITTLSGLVLPTSQLSGFLQAAQFPALTGDVTTTAGSLVTSIADTVVTGKLLTGYTAGPSTPITSSDTVLQALEKLQAQNSFSVPPENVVVVQQNPGTGEFSSIAAAMASITTASASNPFTIIVNAGVYVEPQITMKAYVSLIGQLDAVTVVASNPNVHLIVVPAGVAVATIQGLIISGVTGAGQAGIYSNSPSVQVTNCTLSSNTIGMFLEGISVVVNAVIHACVFSGNTTNEIKCLNSGQPVEAIFHAIPVESTLATSSLDISGAGVRIILSAVALQGDGTNTGIRIYNGANLELTATSIAGYGIGLSVPNIGTAPDLQVASVIFSSNTADVSILNPGTTGSIEATVSVANSTFPPVGNLALLLLDPNGEIFESAPNATQQPNGVFTDTSTLSLQSSAMGLLSGGVITVVSGFTINVTAGYGYLDTNGLSSPPGSVLKITWPSTNITLSALSTNYLYFNSSGTLITNSNFLDTAEFILLGRVVTNSTGVDFIDASPLNIQHYANRNDNFIREALGAIFAFGSIVSEDSTPLHLDVTAGSYFFSDDHFLPSAGTNITFQTFYQNGSGGWVIGSSNTVDTNHYDNGSGTLQPIPSGYYVRDTLYLVGQGINQQYFFVYGQTTYPTLVLAQTGNIPVPPSYFDDGVVLIASIIVKQGSTSIVAGGGQIVDNRPRIGFALPAVEAVGTVTSVGLLDGSTTPIYTISGSPVSSSGTLTFTLANQSANTVFAGPSSGSPAQPTFRSLVAADIPTLNQNTTGTASNITATSNSTLTTLSALSLPGSQVTGNISGDAANITATSNNTLTTLSSLTLPATQLSGTLQASQFPALTGDITTTAGSLVTHLVATSNSTLTTLSALSLPGSQVTGNISGNAANVTGIVSITNGGTGQTTATTAFDALSPLTTLGDTLYFNGTHNARLAGNTTNAREFLTSQGSGGLATAPLWSALVSGDIPNNAANTTGTASNITATTNSTLTSLPNLAVTGSQVGGFTPGSVIFAGATGALAQDNTEFFWDNTNFTLGLGTNTPTAASILTGVNTTAAARPIQLIGYGTGSSTGLRGDFARGTVGTPAAAQSGDTLNFISGRGYGASQFATTSTGVMQIVAGETFTNTSNATYIAFKTTPTGSVTSAERLRINSTGNILVNTTTDNGTDLVQLNGGIISTYSKLAGSTSGYVEQLASATTTSYNITWPAAQGAAFSVPQNNGSGVLSWATLIAGTGISITNAAGSITVNNTQTTAYTTKTANYTILSTDGTIFCDTSGGAFTLTLPSPTSLGGKLFRVIDSTGFFQTNNLTLAPSGGEKIEGLAASKVLQTPWGGFTITTDSVNWFVL